MSFGSRSGSNCTSRAIVVASYLSFMRVFYHVCQSVSSKLCTGCSSMYSAQGGSCVLEELGVGYVISQLWILPRYLSSARG